MFLLYVYAYRRKAIFMERNKEIIILEGSSNFNTTIFLFFSSSSIKLT